MAGSIHSPSEIGSYKMSAAESPSVLLLETDRCVFLTLAQVRQRRMHSAIGLGIVATH